MAINEITYANKSDINTCSVPITNKITASDINEVKTVVNDNANLMGDLSNLSTTDNTSLVNAINEIKNSLVWNTLGTIVGTGTINLPANFNELLCMVKVNGNDNVQLPILIPYPHLSTTTQAFNSGYLQIYNGNASSARVSATTTTASLVNAYLTGADRTSTTETTYYYR